MNPRDINYCHLFHIILVITNCHSAMHPTSNPHRHSPCMAASDLNLQFMFRCHIFGPIEITVLFRRYDDGGGAWSHQSAWNVRLSLTFQADWCDHAPPPSWTDCMGRRAGGLELDVFQSFPNGRQPSAPIPPFSRTSWPPKPKSWIRPWPLLISMSDLA